MLCLEWWAFEIATFEAGIIGEAELASHAVFIFIFNSNSNFNF